MLTRMFSLLLLSFLGSLQAHALEPMSEDELASIQGQEGVQLSMKLRNNTDETGTPLGCSGLLNPCRMGIEFAGRSGIWLMLKDYYGLLTINDMLLESSELPASYTGLEDNNRFLGTDGSCLVAGCDPRNLDAIQVTYPFNKGTGVYNDFTLFMNVGRVGLEFDNSGTPGYLRDAASNSMLGFRAADSTGLNSPLQGRFDGTAYVYGF